MSKKVATPKRISRFNEIARKMMTGPRKLAVTPVQLTAFTKKYNSAIGWVDNTMPSQLAGRCISLGVLGAIGKGVLWYGQVKMEPFVLALAKGNFDGKGDPAHILWLWLTGRAKYNCNIAYRKTVAAIRAYVNDRKFVRAARNGEGKEELGHFAPAETDLFEWDSTFTTMLKRHSNKSRKDFKQGVDEQTEEEIRLAQEVEDALVSLLEDE